MAETELPGRYENALSFSFGDTPAMADSGAANVIARRQVATCGSVEVETAKGAMPEPGRIEIILDGTGRPACAIRTTHTDIVRFNEVDESFAEAEACRDLAEWKDIHQAYFTRLGVYSPRMEVVRQYFELVDVFVDTKQGMGE